MDIQTTAIMGNILINGLLKLIENQNIDLNSITLSINYEDGKKSDDLELVDSIILLQSELKKLATGDYVVMPKVISDEWMANYIEPKVKEYCDQFSDQSYAVTDEELPSIKNDFRKPIRNAHAQLIKVIEEVQGKDHE